MSFQSCAPMLYQYNFLIWNGSTVVAQLAVCEKGEFLQGRRSTLNFPN